MVDSLPQAWDCRKALVPHPGKSSLRTDQSGALHSLPTLALTTLKRRQPFVSVTQIENNSTGVQLIATMASLRTQSAAKLLRVPRVAVAAAPRRFKSSVTTPVPTGPAETNQPDYSIRPEKATSYVGDTVACSR